MSSVAESFKQKGNAAFKEGDYPTAIGHYAAAVLADTQNPTYVLNRAAAYLKLGKFEDAERDCSIVLGLDNSSAKGWFRRGQARLALRKLQEARSDFGKVLQLDDRNEAAQLELKKVDDLLADKSKVSVAVPMDIHTISPTTPPPGRRRVPITIVDPSSPSSAASTSHTQHVEPQPPSDKDNLQKIASQQSLEQPVTPVASAKTTTFKETKQTREAHATRPGGGIFRHNGQHALFATIAETNNTPSSSLGPKGVTKETAGEDIIDMPIEPHKRSVPLPDRAASTATISLFEFTRKWESLSTSSERWRLLTEHAPPNSLPRLFKMSLETTFLISMLRTFQDILQDHQSLHAVQVAVKDYMLNLARVPRFSTVVLLMSREERALVQHVWTSLTGMQDDESTVQAKNVWRVA